MARDVPSDGFPLEAYQQDEIERVLRRFSKNASNDDSVAFIKLPIPAVVAMAKVLIRERSYRFALAILCLAVGFASSLLIPKPAAAPSAQASPDMREFVPLRVYESERVDRQRLEKHLPRIELENRRLKKSEAEIQARARSSAEELFRANQDIERLTRVNRNLQRRSLLGVCQKPQTGTLPWGR